MINDNTGQNMGNLATARDSLPHGEEEENPAGGEAESKLKIGEAQAFREVGVLLENPPLEILLSRADDCQICVSGADVGSPCHTQPEDGTEYEKNVGSTSPPLY